jgi:predicted transposase/invertase (TIGR01784 family)
MNTEADITKEELIKASLERSDSVQTLAQRLLDEGMEKGKYDEKLKIALNLQKKGLSVETIAEVTELNPDDVKKLFEKKKP